MGKRQTATALWVDDAWLVDDPLDGLLEDPTPRIPERALLIAVLEDAVIAVRCGDEDAIAWLSSDETSVTGRGFWFVEICHHLGLNPNAVRAAVAELPPLHRWHYSSPRVHAEVGRLVAA